MHFGLALSVGYESEAEYLDIDLRDEALGELSVEEIGTRLTPCLPVGMDVVGALEVASNEPSLQSTVDVVTWRVVVDEDPDVVEEAVGRLLAATELPISIERKGARQDADLRPAIVEIRVEGPPDAPDGPGAAAEDRGTVLWCELATKPKAFRPGELLAAFDPPLAERRIRRIEQWIIDDGSRRAPVPAWSSYRPEFALRAG
jgi:radical SAM-linked protein